MSGSSISCNASPKRCDGRAMREGDWELLVIDRNYESDEPRVHLYDTRHDPEQRMDRSHDELTLFWRAVRDSAGVYAELLRLSKIVDFGYSFNIVQICTGIINANTDRIFAIFFLDGV